MDAMAAVLITSGAVVLGLGAILDAVSNRIPNWLVLAGLVLVLLGALVAGGSGAAVGALGAAALALVIGFTGFALGAFGGGDAKFLAVGAAFVGLSDLLPFVFVTVLLGGALAVGYVLVRRKTLEATVMTADLGKKMLTLGRRGHAARLGDRDRLTVPYGVAIAGAALLVRFTSIAEWLL